MKKPINMFDMDDRCEELSSDAERMHDSIQSPEVLWGDDWWRDLPPEIQNAYTILGWTESSWDRGIKPPSEDSYWSELTPEMQEAAMFIGYTREIWDAEYTDSDSSDDDLSWIDARGVDTSIENVAVVDASIASRPSFARRNSMTAKTSLEDAGLDLPSESKERESSPPARAPPPPFVDAYRNKVTARVCGPSRSKCGYCSGSRLHVLGVNDGHNQVLPTAEDSEGKSDSHDLDLINTENTSKSYGLLFDHLPYDIYQELIDRGWRRSGKHLYRPHNFESCCPAISIRLDTNKFAPTSKSKQSELEKSILVGGSKSQKRVGRNLCRALGAYNAKHSSCKERNEMRCAVSKKKSNSYLSNEHSCADENDQAMDITHKNKKSRCTSPLHEDFNTTSKKQIKSLSNDTALVIDKQILSAMEKSEQKLLLNLAQTTYQTITQRIKKKVDSDDIPKWAWWKDNESENHSDTPKWCSYKFMPSNQATRKKEGLTESASSTFIMASTVACAAASGRSRGLVDRNELSTEVMKTLEASLSSPERNEESNLEFYSIECHEKSGQIRVILGVPSNYLSGISKTNLTRSESPEVMEEPFTDFLSRYDTEKHSCCQITDSFDAKDGNVRKSKPNQQLHLVVKTVPVYKSSLQPEVHRLFCTYQTATHGDPNPFSSSESNSNPVDSDRDYTHHLEHQSIGFLDIDAVYSELSAAQRARIKKSYLSFYRFLCETPLSHDALHPSCTSKYDEESYLEDGYDVNISLGGTYHQQYRLCNSKDSFNGPLIAVGVVDILPSCVSSVYAFYDPGLSGKLELGKYTALREIEWVRRAKWISNRNYYLGYYIHSCQKMIYKAEYKPSELLCPVHFKWVDFELAKKRLESNSPLRHCCALCETENSQLAIEEIDIRDIVLDIGDGALFENSSLLTVSMLSSEGRQLIDSVIAEYVHEVGPALAQKLAVKLS